MDTTRSNPVERGLQQNPETVVLFQAEEIRRLGQDAVKSSRLIDHETVVLFNADSEWGLNGGESPQLVDTQVRSPEASVDGQLDYLASIQTLRGDELSGEQHSWQNLLSGEVSDVSGDTGIHPSTKKAIKEVGAELDRSIPSFHDYVKTGVDYQKLKNEHPTDRVKFYHSFGNLEAAQAYVADVVRAAVEAGISMSTKSFDHAYDGINIYTHDPGVMQKIIADAYARHPEAFADTEHFLQGPVDGISSKHIGWVQEPEGGLGADSHSVRMGRLGQVLDARGGQLDAATYVEACQAAGVRPEAPWLLSDAQEQAISRENDRVQVERLQNA